MSKFRKKPVVIEAIQYTLDMTMERRREMIALFEGSRCSMQIGADCLVITTVVNGEEEGVTRAVPGDGLIKGVRGEVYPCKPDIFEATYEPVEERGAPPR